VDKQILDGIAEKLDRVPAVVGKAVRWATAQTNGIVNADHPDIFAGLGPVYFFNAMCALVERRTHDVVHSDAHGFGIRLSGGNPVRVSDVVYGGPAADAGMKCGDYIIEVGGVDVRCSHSFSIVIEGTMTDSVTSASRTTALRDALRTLSLTRTLCFVTVRHVFQFPL